MSIQEFIIENYPNESVGLILKDDTIVYLTNISETPEKSFKIDGQEIAEHLDNIKSIWHSHCVNPSRPSLYDARTPSLKDMESQKQSNVEWLIYACDGYNVTEPVSLPRKSNNNYLDREFIWFINDCYTLVQDYYKHELNIELKDYILHDYKNVRKSHSVFDEHITEFGFIELYDLNDLRNGDLFIVDNSGFEANHLVIYHDGKLLHQGLLSCIEPFETYSGKFKKRLRYAG